MKSVKYALLLVVFSILAGCGARVEPLVEPPVASGKVSGSVTYRERIALPPDAVLQVALLDVSRMDVAATLIAEQTIVPEHGVPIPFELEYDPDVIDARLVYAVRATISSGDNLLFVTDTHYPVLTRGHGNEVDLVLVRSGGGSAAVADAELTNTRWMLRTMDGEAVHIEANRRAPYLQFDRVDDKGMAHGYSGCNSFTGSYLAAGSTLAFDQMLSTMRACPDMQLEDRFLEILSATDTYLIESTWLILSGAGVELATFEAWYE
jgi:putative lipoprotein